MVPDNPQAYQNLEQAILAVSQAIAQQGVSIAQNRYKFSAKRTAAYTTAASVFTLMPFDAIEWNTDTGFSIATGRYTVQATGYYQFNWRLSSATATNLRMIASLNKNAAEISRGSDITTTTPSALGSALILCAAGDIIDVRYYITGAVALEIGNGVQMFSGYLVTQV